MRSIRLSLVFYFLVLLALALGAVSVLVYDKTRQTLHANMEKTQELLRTKHADDCQKERDKLDEELVAQARTLASLVPLQYEWNRGRFQTVYPLGLLTAGPSTNGHLLAPVWIAGGVRGPLADQLHRLVVTDIQFNEDALDPDVHKPEYFQINSEWGRAWRSTSMADDSFPFDHVGFAKTKFFDWKLDDTLLSSSAESVRRVTVKVPVVRRIYSGHLSRSSSSRSGSSGAGPNSKPPPRSDKLRGTKPPILSDPDSEMPAPSERVTERASPAILIQCASSTQEREKALAEPLSKLDMFLKNEMAELESQSEQTLRALRNDLLLISLATFGATVVGGFMLVWLGLLPLRRLSDAVSRVSEKDFRLQLDDRRLPRELRPIAERLSQTLDQLKGAFAREKQAAADISHELRTPVAALLTTTEVALRKTRNPEEYREFLEDCRASGQQMNLLVERLLKLARLDAGVDTLRPEKVDVADLAKQCAGLVRPLAEVRGLSLHVHSEGPTALTADPDKLREVLTNLLHNAIEYNRPEGTVDVTVARQNGNLQVEVRDTGIGISSEAREHIFERFYRADPSRQADGLHAGLGLSIVKGYVDLMGATIDVESVEGQGSTFRVHLPVC